VQTYIKKIFSDSAVYSFGIVLNRLLGFLLLPVYTHYFTPDEFGVYSLVYAFWFFAAVFYLYGMETSFQKYFIETEDIEGKRNIYSSTLLLIFITSLVLSAVIYSGSGLISSVLTGNPGNAYLFRLLSLLLFIDALSRFPMILINSRQISKVYTFINVSAVIVNIAFNVVFIIILKYGLEGIFYASIISYSYIFLVSFLYCIKYFLLRIKTESLKILLRFARSFLLYGIFLISLDVIDRFLLGFFKGNEEVGIYSACYRIGVVMNLAVSGFRVAWIPFFLDLKSKQDNKQIFSRVFTYFTFGAMLLFLIIALFSDDLVRIRIGDFTLIDQKYWGGTAVIPYILLAYFFFGLYTNINVASYFQNKISYLIISSAAGGISNVIFNLILIPPFSLLGAAVSTLLSYLLMFIILYVYSQKIYPMRYEWKRILTVVIIGILLYIVNLEVPGFFPGLENNALTLILVKIFSVLIFLTVLFIFRSGSKIGLNQQKTT
jgi:O-antigen/teichoic acid export membrane protein